MYVVAAEACTVPSGESPPDQARIQSERSARAELEAGTMESFEAMARAVHRKPQDFADVADRANLTAVAASYPDMAPKRVPARLRLWPDGYGTKCTVRQPLRSDVVPLRPIYDRPFPIASSTAPLAPPTMECPMQAYLAPYPARRGIPEVGPADKSASGRNWLWALAVIAAAAVVAS